MDEWSPKNIMEQRIVDKAAALRIPVSGSLELSPLCNMDCDMCYVRLSRAEQERLGHLLTAKEWLKIAEQIKDTGCIFLLLTGGEPFLYPEFRTLYGELCQMGFALTINTNGTLIDEEVADWLAKTPPRRVNITLYGADETTYGALCHFPDGFERAVRGIRLLRERHVDVKANCSMVAKNAAQMDALMDICECLDVPVTIDTYMYPARRERQIWHAESRLSAKEAAKCAVHIQKRQMPPEKFAAFCREVRDRTGENFPGLSGEHVMSCRAGRNSFFVTWQGKMKPCVFLPEPAVDLREVSVKEAWAQIVRAVDAVRLNADCLKCGNRPVCNICPASAYWEAGRYDAAPAYQCAYVDEIVRLFREEATRSI